MKQIAIILAFIAFSTGAMAQLGRGTYGTNTPYQIINASLYNNLLVAKAADSLKGVDTVYAYFSFGNAYRAQFTVQTVQTDDTLSGTAVLQAWAGPQTGWVTRTGYWESITGQTALCTSCVAANKTYTLTTGTTRSTWDIGNTGSGPSTFSNWRIKITGTRSTDTTAVTAWAWISY